MMVWPDNGIVKMNKHRSRHVLSSYRTMTVAMAGLALFFGLYTIGSWSLSNYEYDDISTRSAIEYSMPKPQHLPSDDPCRSSFPSHHSKVSISRPPPPPQFDFLCHDPAVQMLQVLDPPTTMTTIPKILCLVLTHSNNHATKMKAVVDTWGSKCHALIGASNVTDPTVHAYRIESPESQKEDGYWGIWDKLVQTLRQILDGTLPSILPSHLIENDNNKLDFDWILKADDDTYVIMENLQSFLANITTSGGIEQKEEQQEEPEPRIYGRVMAWPRLKRFQDMQGWFGHDLNREFGKRFYAKVNEDDTLRFSHGGPGYIMNRAYARQLVHAYTAKTAATPADAIKGQVAEDIANAVTMLYHGISPRSTFDLDSGRERMHPESPQTMYADPIWMERMHHGMKGSVHGPGEKCCSPASISFHYVADFQMRLLDYQLYHCPRG